VFGLVFGLVSGLALDTRKETTYRSPSLVLEGEVAMGERGRTLWSLDAFPRSICIGSIWHIAERSIRLLFVSAIEVSLCAFRKRLLRESACGIGLGEKKQCF